MPPIIRINPYAKEFVDGYGRWVRSSDATSTAFEEECLRCLGVPIALNELFVVGKT